MSLHEALATLREATQLVTGADPEFGVTHALSVAWSEVTLALVHQMSCEDPVTGLSSTAHLRSRLSELYRGGLREPAGARGHAIVVIEDLAAPADDPISHALHAARVGHLARTVFAGPETVARGGNSRVLVLTERDEMLGRRVALLRRMLGDRNVRVWIEGLPSTDVGAGLLVEELART
ncbi:hypothetical protein [Nocardioides limicola]|uniref:hypothetical protein n=1 Tax=Nocardioides limicola TaxID=2803368 RepID=UPI001EEF9E3E|nr:hypothetical protein [Nocardioides sp. DJM-14]